MQRFIILWSTLPFIKNFKKNLIIYYLLFLFFYCIRLTYTLKVSKPRVDCKSPFLLVHVYDDILDCLLKCMTRLNYDLVHHYFELIKIIVSVHCDTKGFVGLVLNWIT
jgi:hypothetical protein